MRLIIRSGIDPRGLINRPIHGSPGLRQPRRYVLASGAALSPMDLFKNVSNA